MYKAYKVNKSSALSKKTDAGVDKSSNLHHTHINAQNGQNIKDEFRVASVCNFDEMVHMIKRSNCNYASKTTGKKKREAVLSSLASRTKYNCRLAGTERKRHSLNLTANQHGEIQFAKNLNEDFKAAIGDIESVKNMGPCDFRI